ncbi:MAG: hypothetical protein C3F11_20995 [Methylocystaceae bacterium]|nr:MAG: hypothetical protein C3F11_20995 [Methylocystaceae bacterium]
MTKKFLTAGLVALTLTGSTLAASSSAQAKPYHWHHGHHGHYWGGAAAAGVLGALAIGAIAANSYGGGCYITRQPVTDGWGNFVYYRRVRVCD